MTTLAELRKANLQEQKERAQEPSYPTPPPPSSAPDETRRPARVEAAPPAPAVSGNGMKPASTAPSVEDRPSLRVVDSQPEQAPVALELSPDTKAQSASLLERVRERVAHKVVHPNGVKVTVDITPALFSRAKRYCLDHNNVTVRQVFIELMTTFLEEEGY